MTAFCTFNPQIKTVGQLPRFSLDQIREEPMLFACDPGHVGNLGGPIANSLLEVARASGFLDDLEPGLHIVMDTRSTLTMPGMYPSIPGWHCDDFNRSERFAQPSIVDRDRRIKHLMAIVPEGDQEISATEFVTRPISIALDEQDVWHSLDDYLNQMEGAIDTRKISAREVITFNQEAIHRATPTVSNGWRFFGRISRTYRPPQNELRKQVQVFVTKNGW